MAGMEFDSTGLYHAGARQYSPVLQRFLSEDPIRGKANMYGYAGNNPITGSDISGLQTEDEGGTGGQENAGDANGLAGLWASLLESIYDAIFGGGGGNPAPNFQRFQNMMTFGRFNRTVGVSPNPLVFTQSGKPLPSIVS